MAASAVGGVSGFYGVWGRGGRFPSFAQRRTVIQTNVPAIRSGLLYNKAPVAPQPERLEAAACRD